MTQFFLLKDTNVTCLLLVVIDDRPTPRQVIVRFEKDIHDGRLKHTASWDTRPGKNNGYVATEVRREAANLANEVIHTAKRCVQKVTRQKRSKATEMQLALAL